ncbi:sulfatase [Rubritalea tangerina]|uniref:Sulfatase n=1 Tax=Rubritalea tangerina TaxID=430798 RepID=A0ABW4ZFN8_9BACT
MILSRLLSICLLSLTSLQAAQKPNIVLIMADDLGYGGIGCYGAKQTHTPNLDALAATGVRCTDFHSNGAVCSPTRAALFTGRYQQRCGITGVVTAKNHRDTGLALDEVTFAEELKKQGYTTALFGKWHIGYPKHLHPIHQGFDHFTGFVSGNVDYHRFIDQEGFYDWWKQDQPHQETGYLTDLISKKAVDFISNHKDTPFCLVLTHGAPHYPIQGRNSPGFREIGKARTGTKLPGDPKSIYREMIEVMDEGIGNVVAQLDAHKLRENTLIIFCSDNGPASLGSSGGLRGKKGQIYEGGHRVCGIFNWIGSLPAGSTCHTPILTMDLFPTFLAMAQAQPTTKLDGINVLPILQSDAQEKRDPLFWQIKQNIAVRDGHWKLILNAKTEKSELYNLNKDIKESNNCISDHPEIAKKLESLARNWIKEMQPYPKKS